MEGKDLNEGIRTMALMEFMKLMEPTQLMEGLIYIHGADLSDSIDGAYENNRICVFFIHVMEFQKRNNSWHRRYSLTHFPQRGLNLKSCVLPISLQEPLKHL